MNAAHFISHAAGNTAEFEQTGFFLPRRVLQTQVGLKGVKTHIINTSKEAERECVCQQEAVVDVCSLISAFL